MSSSTADDERGINHSLYDEYVRGFDEVPVLNDAVSVPPRPPRPPSFVRGERRSLRGEERPDSYSLREASLAEIELLYREYAAPKPVGRKPRKRAAKKSNGRKSRRAASTA
ncbi:MAG TPA: hypothetical protein VKA43_04950 [Gammaproteobacteria bacterium]|nr:hypothetical protein [Gammaproteobacteria bacterium]